MSIGGPPAKDGDTGDVKWGSHKNIHRALSDFSHWLTKKTYQQEEGKSFEPVPVDSFFAQDACVTLKMDGSNLGIHVAKLAGMPNFIVQRATKMLKDLEKIRHTNDTDKIKKIAEQEDLQLSIFQLDDPILEQIRDEVHNMDIENLTPIEALMKLNEIKKLIVKK